jgi:hypothetical protein
LFAMRPSEINEKEFVSSKNRRKSERDGWRTGE